MSGPSSPNVPATAFVNSERPSTHSAESALTVIGPSMETCCCAVTPLGDRRRKATHAHEDKTRPRITACIAERVDVTPCLPLTFGHEAIHFLHQREASVHPAGSA